MWEIFKRLRFCINAYLIQSDLFPNCQRMQRRITKARIYDRRLIPFVHPGLSMIVEGMDIRL